MKHFVCPVCDYPHTEVLAHHNPRGWVFFTHCLRPSCHKIEPINFGDGDDDRECQSTVQLYVKPRFPRLWIWLNGVKIIEKEA